MNKKCKYFCSNGKSCNRKTMQQYCWQHNESSPSLIKIQKPTEICNIVPYLVKHSKFLNRIFTFLHPDFMLCGRGSEGIETRCGTSFGLVRYTLSGKLPLSDFNNIVYPTSGIKSDVEEIYQILEKYNFIGIGADSTDYQFGGHQMAIAKINTNKYYILQSYLNEYNLQVATATSQGVKKLISGYRQIFDGMKMWDNLSASIWKKITGASVSSHTNAPKNFEIYTPQIPIKIKTEHCQKYIRSLLKQAVKELSKNKKELLHFRNNIKLFLEKGRYQFRDFVEIFSGYVEFPSGAGVEEYIDWIASVIDFVEKRIRNISSELNDLPSVQKKSIVTSGGVFLKSPTTSPKSPISSPI